MVSDSQTTSGRPFVPVPRGGFSTNEDEARWLEQTILLRVQEMMALAGMRIEIVPNSLYELLLMSLDDASKRGVKTA